MDELKRTAGTSLAWFFNVPRAGAVDTHTQNESEEQHPQQAWIRTTQYSKTFFKDAVGPSYSRNQSE